MSPAFEMNATQKAIMMEVIDMYKTMSYLWDQSHPSYQDRPLRIKAYKKLLEKYQELDKDATIALLKAKLDNMRTGYARELKKVRESQNNSVFGTDDEFVYRPCLWYYDLFNFLEDTILNSTKRKKVKLEEEQQDIPQRVLYDEDYDEASQHNTEYSLPAEYLEEDEQSESNSSIEIPVKRSKYDIQVEAVDSAPYREGDWEIIGKAIGVQLRDVDSHQAAIAQKLIADAIFYAKLGKLREDSNVSID